ncbi:hypothetical protein D3C85_293190 [compost metagenome]
MKPLILFFLVVVIPNLNGCSNFTQLPYMSTEYESPRYKDFVYMKNIRDALTTCREEAMLITLVNYEAQGRKWSEEQVKEVERKVFESCLRYRRVVI